ncbi:MAG: metallophosphoesterase, partial [Clostridia bacterium]|nr:metallophosphoesterase [Clostridia bacterium]
MNSFLVPVFKNIFLLIFSAYLSITGTALISPSAETPITPSGDANLVFAAIADPQVSNYLPERYNYFQASAKDLQNAEGLDALINVGDVAENGLAMEYSLVIDGLSGMKVRHIACEGNHDIRLRVYEQSLARFGEFVNTLNGDSAYTCFHYSEEINGYKFIVLGSDRTEFEENYLSPEQLEWLDGELASVEDGMPRFVLVHQPLKNTNGLPMVWNSPIDSA